MTQTKVGWRAYVSTTTASTLWNSIYSVYNADSVGSSSLKTSLVAAYNGESNTNDSFGTNNGTAVGGLTYTTGKVGNAFQFANVNSYINIPNTTDHLNFTGDFSISLWVNYNTLASSNEIFLTNMKAGGTWGSGWLFSTDPTTLSFAINAQSVVNRFAVPFLPSINTWYHLVMTRKRSTETKIYINGALQSGTYSYNNPTLDPTYQSGQEYNIGAYILPQRYFSNIRIDAVNIWQKELTSSEITELYNSGNGAQYITDSFYKPTTNNALGTNNGTAQGGLTYGVGKVGTAFQFNGTNSQIDFAANTMNVGDTFSVSFWAYMVTADNSGQTIISNFNEINGGLNKYGWFIRATNGIFYFSRFIGATSQFDLTATANTINNWQHLTFTRSSNSTKIYVNGALASQNTNTQVTQYVNTISPRIGSREVTGVWRLANGTKIDAFNIWNKELTQTEITELYNSGNAKQYPN
jgi:hypothetical protein